MRVPSQRQAGPGLRPLARPPATTFPQGLPPAAATATKSQRPYSARAAGRALSGSFRCCSSANGNGSQSDGVHPQIVWFAAAGRRELDLPLLFRARFVAYRAEPVDQADRPVSSPAVSAHGNTCRRAQACRSNCLVPTTVVRGIVTDVDRLPMPQFLFAPWP